MSTEQNNVVLPSIQEFDLPVKEESDHGGKIPTNNTELIEYLWMIIDDIDSIGDIAKSDDKLYRDLVEKRQKERWLTGITSDGYVLTIPEHLKG